MPFLDGSEILLPALKTSFSGSVQIPRYQLRYYYDLFEWIALGRRNNFKKKHENKEHESSENSKFYDSWHSVFINI